MLAAGGADDPGAGGDTARTAAKPVPNQGADVGGAGDVPDRQQGHQAGEGAHPGFHGWFKVQFICKH